MKFHGCNDKDNEMSFRHSNAVLGDVRRNTLFWFRVYICKIYIELSSLPCVVIITFELTVIGCGCTSVDVVPGTFLH